MNGTYTKALSALATVRIARIAATNVRTVGGPSA